MLREEWASFLAPEWGVRAKISSELESQELAVGKVVLLTALCGVSVTDVLFHVIFMSLLTSQILGELGPTRRMAIARTNLPVGNFSSVPLLGIMYRASS